MQSLLEQNILLNKAAIAAGGGSVQCCELTWGVTSVSSLAQGWATPDLVVAADVVYHRELFDPLLSTLDSLGKTACLLCAQLYALCALVCASQSGQAMATVLSIKFVL